MADLTFILDGDEPISGDDLERQPLDPLDKAMLLAQRNHLRRRLGNLSCREHGQGAHITAAGPSADRLVVSIEGCCPQLVDQARATLEAATPELVGGAYQATPAEALVAPFGPNVGPTEPAGSAVTPMPGTAAPVEETGGVGRLTDDEERALEAVRRQLDIEFPRIEATGDANWEGDEKERAPKQEQPPGRGMRAAALVGTLLLVSAVGSAAGLLTASLRVRSADAPARVDTPVVADREAPPPPPPIVEPARPRSRIPARTRPSRPAWAPDPWATKGLPTANTAHSAAVQAP